MPTGPQPPGPEATAAVVATHISMLVLTGNRVLKFRKPVVTDFCDFSTSEARADDCRREVELNRRLTDDVYLGVAHVRLDSDTDTVDPEPCVVMRRLPADRQLSALVERGEDIGPEVHAVAARLAAFHRGAERSDAISRDGGLDAVRQLWQVAVDRLRPDVTDADDRRMLDDVEALQARWFDGRAALYLDRVHHGHVCDGHGDLRCDNIFCLGDGPRILDCIEFDDHLRHVDLATDIAFLVMDLRRRGRTADAAAFVAAYEEAVAAVVPRPLLEHGVAYWALVRAKVAHLRAAQGDATGSVEARELLHLAHEHLQRARPRLVLVGGLPGSGKSTVASRVAREQGWVLVSSDRLRKELAGLPSTARTGDAFGEGLYDPGHTAATYDALLTRAREALERGETVVVDASWGSAGHRRAAAALAESVAAELHEVRLVVDPDLARARIEARAARDDDPSDAGVRVAQALAEVADPWPAATPVDTSGPLEDTVAHVAALLG
jgi:aminoglycoside phosphotransferase family enzyme/predicted kinase